MVAPVSKYRLLWHGFVQEVALMICAHLEFKYDFLTQLVSRISGSCERVSNLSCLVSLRVRVRVPGNSPATAYWT